MDLDNPVGIYRTNTLARANVADQPQRVLVIRQALHANEAQMIRVCDVVVETEREYIIASEDVLNGVPDFLPAEPAPQ